MPSQGPNSPTAAANDTSAGTRAWETPGNVFGSDNAYAQASAPSVTALTYYLKATGFGFTVPSGATINGIVVEIERRASGTVKDASVRLYKGGALAGADRGDLETAWPTSDASRTYGGATDLWGTTWTPADVNSSTFGVGLQAQMSPLAQALVDHIRVTVYYTEAPGSGSLSMTQVI